jgi:hypothetical protein
MKKNIKEMVFFKGLGVDIRGYGKAIHKVIKIIDSHISIFHKYFTTRPILIKPIPGTF